MIPKIHAKGSSFKGAAAYLLHDKDRAQSAERVAWVETRNLATEDAEIGWRIMAATAMDQARLKAEAGVKATGRKSDKHVMHVSLSWHADEAHTLNRDEMMRAANGALRVLGADDRQAMIIAHSDEKHPHVHLLVNRVSPEDGRHLSSSKEKLKLSEWALDYEEVRGQILCEERAINAEARRRGEYTRAEKDQPRHIFETEARAAANDNQSRADQLREEERGKDAELSKRSRTMHARRQEEWDALHAAHMQRKSEIEQQAEIGQGKAKADVREEYRPLWRDTFRKQQDDMQAFETRESDLLGRVQNTLDAVSLRLRVLEGTKGEAIGGAFRALASSGARREAVELAHEREKAAIERQQRLQETLRAQEVEKARQAAQEANAARFESDRAALILAHAADQAKNQAEWRIRTAERKAAWEQFQEQHLHRPAPTVTLEQKSLNQHQLQKRMQQDVGNADNVGKDIREARIREFLERTSDLGDERSQGKDPNYGDDIDH